jgi:periplasmic protein TonB
MSVLLEHDEQLERELAGEPFAAPVTGSVLLHVAIAGAIIAYYIVGGFFKSNLWGGPNVGGAIQVNLVSSAIPLPSDVPPNQNVLATEKPSPAPAPPEPKAAAPKVDEQAIPIASKKEQPKPQPQPKQQQKTQQPVQTNKAQYGEMAANNLPRAVQGQTNPGPTSITQGDFGSRFAWYVDAMNRKMSQSWNKFEVDSRTPKGGRAYITFVIAKNGQPGNPQLDRSSGSPTLDRSCLRAVQRVDTFGALPGGYNGNTVNVSYYCEY